MNEKGQTQMVTPGVNLLCILLGIIVIIFGDFWLGVGLFVFGIILTLVLIVLFDKKLKRKKHKKGPIV